MRSGRPRNRRSWPTNPSRSSEASAEWHRTRACAGPDDAVNPTDARLVEHAIAGAGREIAGRVRNAVAGASPQIALVDSLDFTGDDIAMLQLGKQLESLCGQLTAQHEENRRLLAAYPDRPAYVLRPARMRGTVREMTLEPLEPDSVERVWSEFERLQRGASVLPGRPGVAVPPFVVMLPNYNSIPVGEVGSRLNGLEPVPGRHQHGQVGLQVLVFHPGPRGAADQPHARGQAKSPQDRPQPAPFLGVVDPFRHPDMTGVGHQQGAERLAARPAQEPGDLGQLPRPGRRVAGGTRRRTSATAASTSGTRVTREASVSIASASAGTSHAHEGPTATTGLGSCPPSRAM